MQISSHGLGSFEQYRVYFRILLGGNILADRLLARGGADDVRDAFDVLWWIGEYAKVGT